MKFGKLEIMRGIVLALLLIQAKPLLAQDSTLIFIEANRLVSEVLTPDKIYQHPQFVKSQIFFRDGSLTEALLNYNYLNGEIEFIGPGRDTLAIAKDQMLNIKKVIIDSHFYFYDQGYLEQVDENTFGKLLRKQMYVVTRREKIGAYNQPTSISAIDSYGSFTHNYGSFTSKLKVQENITLALKSHYFFGDQYNTILPATKKNLVKLYPSKKQEIEAYLKQHPVNFKNSTDLKDLFSSL